MLRAEQGGGWEVLRAPAPAGVELVGYRDRAGRGLDAPVLPQPGLTLVLLFDGDLRFDRTAVASGLVSGVGVNSVRVRGSAVACVDVHLSPLAAYPLLGGAAAELAGSVAGLEELWGARAGRLRAALAGAGGWPRRFAELRAVLAERSRAGRAVDPEVAFAWRGLVASGGRRRTGELAAAAGWSRKRLWSRFGAQIGVTPKRAARLLRLAPAIEAVLAGHPAAEVAVRCGYADQSHLSRDLRELAGCTPGALRRDWLAAGPPLR